MINLEPELLVKYAFGKRYDELPERYRQAAVQACRCVLVEDDDVNALLLFNSLYEDQITIPAVTQDEIKRIRSAIVHARGVRELIIKLQEEHLEVAHVCSKILLYGFDDVSPVEIDKGTNRDRLHRELGDAKLFTWLLIHEKLIDNDAISKNMWAKLKVLPKWLKHYVITPEIEKVAKQIQVAEEKMKAGAARLSGFAQQMRDSLTPKEREFFKTRMGVGDDQGSDE